MDNNTNGCSGCTGVWWWLTAMVAVIAVPSFGVVVAFMSGTQGMMQVAVFLITCWVCTYLGMRLMRHPMASQKIFKK